MMDAKKVKKIREHNITILQYALIAIIIASSIVLIWQIGKITGAFTANNGEWENSVDITADNSTPEIRTHLIFGNYKPASCADGIYVESSGKSVQFRTENEVYAGNLCSETDVVFANSGANTYGIYYGYIPAQTREQPAEQQPEITEKQQSPLTIQTREKQFTIFSGGNQVLLSRTPDAATLKNGTDVLGLVNVSDDNRAELSIDDSNTSDYADLTWSNQNILANSTINGVIGYFEHNESTTTDVDVLIQWFNGTDFESVCSGLQRLSEGTDSCNLTSKINTITKANNITLRYLFNRTAPLFGIKMSGLDYTNLTIDYTNATTNGPPTQANPLLISTSGNNLTTDNITCYNQSTSDPDGDNVTNIYDWYKNNNSITAIYYTFDTNQSTTTTDYSGNNKSATLGNGTAGTSPTWTSAGRVGGAYNFNSANHNCILGANNSVMGVVKNVTIELWLKSSTYGDASKRAIVVGFGGYGMYFNFQTYAGDICPFFSGTSASHPSTSTNYADGNWHYIVAMNNGTITNLYVDGIKNNDIGDYAENIYNNSALNRPSLIGAGGLWCVSDWFNGTLDEIAVYPNIIFNAAQIQQRYNDMKDGFTNNRTIVSQQLAVNDTWMCQVTPNDAKLDGTTNNSNVLTILSSVPPAPPINETTDWPMIHKNLAHTGYNPVNGPTNLSANVRYFNTGDIIYDSSPAVSNGVVYIGSDDNNVYALDASNISKKLGSYTTGNYVTSSPAVSNGVVYIGSYDRNVYALNASNISQSLGSYDTGSYSIGSSPAVSNGVVYIGSEDNKVYALNASNISQKLGSYTTGDYIDSSPAVSNGIVYVGSADSKVYALNASNISQKLGSYTTGGSVISSPSVANGVVYIGSYDHNVYALNASNISQKLGNYTTGDIIYDSSAAVSNGIVYIGGWDNKVYALNASNISQKLGSYTTGDHITSSPAVSNGIVYIGSYDHKVYAFGTEDLLPLQVNLPPSPYKGQNVTVNVSVMNNGSFDSGTFNISFLVDNAEQSRQLAQINAETTQNYVFYWTAVLGSHNLTIAVDPNNAEVETNETNNNITTTVNVTDPTNVTNCANLTIPGLTYTLSQNLTGLQADGGAVCVGVYSCCIDIEADNITLNCNGYNISSPSGAHGIQAVGRKNITVENCGVNGYGNGVHLESTNNSIVETSRVTNSVNNGIFSTGGWYNQIISNYLSGDSTSIKTSSRHEYVYNNTLIGSYVDIPGGFNITVANNFISGAGLVDYTGVTIYGASNNTIFNNTITTFPGDYGHCIEIYEPSSHNAITYNSLSNCTIGIRLWDAARSNTFAHNSITNNSWGFFITDDFAVVYNNTFWDNYISNPINVNDSSTGNFWNTTYSCGTPNIIDGNCTGGNFWSDYNGTDDGSGAYPHNISGDGIGDTNLPWKGSTTIVIGGDFLPLVNVTVFNMTIDLLPLQMNVMPANLTAGELATINVSVKNNGTIGSGLFNISFLVDDIEQSRQETNLDFGMTQIYTFNWTAIAGSHNLTIAVDPDDVQSETDETNNNITTAVDVASVTCNLAVLINGVNTTSFTNAGEPYNVTVNVTYTNGSAFANAFVMIKEENGYSIFAMPQFQVTNVTNFVYGETTTNANGLVSFTAIPTGGVDVDNSAVGPYNITVASLINDTACDSKSFTVTNANLPYATSDVPQVPNLGDIRAFKDKVAIAYLRIKDWVALGGGENKNIIIYDNNTASGLGFTVIAGKPYGMNITVLNSSDDSPIPNAAVTFQEMNGFPPFILPQALESNVTNFAAGEAFTDANGNVQMTIVPTGGVDINEGAIGGYIILLDVYNGADRIFNTTLTCSGTDCNFPYASGSATEVPNMGNVKTFKDKIAIVYLRIKSWLANLG